MKPHVLFSVFWTGVVLCATLGAQPPATNPDSMLTMILQDMEGSPLSLEVAIQHALRGATRVRQAEGAYLAAEGKARRERGEFDPELFFIFNHRDQQEATASFFSGAPVLMTEQTTSRSGLRWDLPFGTEFTASLNTVRLKTNSGFAFLNPQYTAFGSLDIRQPLLRGLLASGRKELTKAEHELDASKARYDQEALRTSTEVERRYWDLYAAERDYAVQKLVLDQANSFLQETEVRASAGLIGPNQVATARTFLAEQQILILDREEQLDNFSDQLASFIGVRPPGGAQRFLTVDDPPDDFPMEPVEDLIARARANNLELHASQADVEAAKAESRAAGWEILPSIDVVGSLGGIGLAGDAQDVIFGGDTLRTTRGGTLGDAIDQVTRRNFPNWSVGIEVTIPIGFRGGIGEKDRLDAEEMIATQRHIQKERTLEEEVRTSYRELYHGKRRLQAAKEGVAAAQEQVRIGLIEFYNGRSTAFELVRLGADFASARRRYSESLVRTAKAATTLKQLTSGGYPSAQSSR